MWISLGMLLGRILLSIIFIVSGIGMFMDYQGTAGYMASKGMTMIPLFLYAAALIQIIGGLSILLGYKARYGAVLLIIFLIPVSVIFHDFWNISDAAMGKMQMILFMHNLAIFGGLLYIISCGAGGWSCDRCCKKT